MYRIDKYEERGENAYKQKNEINVSPSRKHYIP